MPLLRRLPKIGFYSAQSKLRAEVRLHELELVKDDLVDLAALKKHRLIPKITQHAKVIASGKIKKAVKVVGLAVTPGARVAIESAGGSEEQ